MPQDDTGWRGLVRGLDRRALEDLLDALFSHSPDAVGVSGNLVIRMVNPALIRMFGYSDASELAGRSVLDLIAPEARPMIEEFARRRREREEVPPAYVTRGLRRDGSEFSVELRSTAFELDGEPHSLTIVRDVSRENVAERMIRQGEEFYRALFDVNTAIKLLISPATGRIIDANQAAVEFYGWPLETLRSMTVSDINTLEPAEIEAEMERARNGRRRYFRFRHRTASGEIRHVEVYSGPLHLDDEELLLSIVHDVTERDALEGQLRQAQRLESIGRLAGGIAHDFNNLLTVMMSSADIMSKRVEPDSSLRPHLDDISYAARRASDLTRGLLAFSRRQVMRPRAIDLDEVIERMKGLLQRALGSSIAVQTHLAGKLPAVSADPAQIEQVIMNLALNARDAMPQGGTLTLRTSVVTIAEGEATPVPAGTWVTLAVGDEGQGMDPETQRRVFEPFFTTKPAGHGTGLGLATVHGIIAQSRGHVTVRSTPGRGTEFTIYLAVLAEQHRPSEPPPRRKDTGPAGANVLLVDDMDQVRSTLVRGLRAKGYHVTEASSAAEALELPPEALDALDILVTDIVMPGCSGVELAAEVLRRRPELPVLLISGDRSNHDLSALPETVQFLQKPFTVAELASRIDEMIEPSPA